jgi:hypothetical protein
MARYDRDQDITINTPTSQKNIDKPKGQMSIRDAAAMEMPEQHIETSRPGTTVHGFGNGQIETPKRHTDLGQPQVLARSTGESVTMLVEQLFQLPFHAQLSVMRMLATRVLGALDAGDQEKFLRDLRSELQKVEPTEETEEARAPDAQDVQGT